MIEKPFTLTKGQAHTLEAIAGAIIILTGVVFAQSVTAITPLTASTASQQSENQQGELVKGLASITNSDDTLKDTILYWDNANQRYHNSSGETVYYTLDTPNSRFGEVAKQYFIDKGIGIRIDLIYYREVDGDLERVRNPYIDFGTPSTNASTTTQTVALYDSDVLVNENRSDSSIQLEDSSSTFYIDDIDPDSELYNIIEIEMTVWRI